MRVVRWIGIGILALAAALVLLFLGARYHDGPLAAIPGGPLASGAWVSEPVADWSFARDEQEIELQLAAQPRSRTVWIVVEGGEAFIPCSLDFPPFKTWYRHAARDGRAILRIQDRRYPVALERVEDAERARAVGARVREKYETPPLTDPERVWFFRVRSRPGATSSG
jgi:hypothetical protein